MKDLHEGLPELDIEGGINDGIDSTVDISKPSEGIVHCLWDIAVTMHVQDVGDEEGEPTDYKDSCSGQIKESK